LGFFDDFSFQGTMGGNLRCLEFATFSGTFAASLAETGQGTGAVGACRGAQRWMTFFWGWEFLVAEMM